MTKGRAQSKRELEKRYLHTAIAEYEYSPAPEYKKSLMTPKAAEDGTLDFDYESPDSDVEISRDGAWVKSRVGVPKEWLKKKLPCVSPGNLESNVCVGRLDTTLFFRFKYSGTF
jgi:hypothetical protein